MSRWIWCPLLLPLLLLLLLREVEAQVESELPDSDLIPFHLKHNYFSFFSFKTNRQRVCVLVNSLGKVVLMPPCGSLVLYTVPNHFSVTRFNLLSSQLTLASDCIFRYVTQILAQMCTQSSLCMSTPLSELNSALQICGLRRRVIFCMCMNRTCIRV